jgi:hypothetical protein
VATRRRYDSRLLLAHLGRLDRLAGKSLAGEQADRFDEVLAVLAGEAPPPGCFDAEGNGAANAAAPEVILPPDRAHYIHAAASLATTEAWETWHAAFLEGRAEAEDEPQPDYGGYYDEAAEDWDDWQARAFARVDALVGEGASPCGDEAAAMEPAVEYKSMEGPPAGRGPAVDFPLYRANRVNPARRETAQAKKCKSARERIERPAVMLDEGRRGDSPPPPTAALADPSSAEIKGLPAGGSAREQGQLDAAGTGANQADLLGGGFAEVDHAVAVEGPTIVDGHDHRIARAGVSHPHFAAEGQSAMSGGESIGIEALPTGSAIAGQLVPVIARDARAQRFELRAFGNSGFGKSELGGGCFGNLRSHGRRGFPDAFCNGDVFGEHGARKRERGQNRNGGNMASAPVTRSK